MGSSIRSARIRRAIFLATTFSALSFGAASSRARSNAPQQSNPPQTQRQPAPTTQKKVWTDDNVSELHAAPGDTISQPGKPGSSRTRATVGSTAGAGSKNKNAKSYQDQIAKLQAKIPRLDEQIAQLQAAIDGKPTGDAKSSSRPRGVKADDWAIQLAELQKQRDDTLNRIATLQDEARHKGVPANAVP